jgi:Mg-chelatase subunit ChlD
MVIDPEGKGTRAGMAATLAQKLRATYYPLEAPDPDAIVKAVKDTLLGAC